MNESRRKHLRAILMAGLILATGCDDAVAPEESSQHAKVGEFQEPRGSARDSWLARVDGEAIGITALRRPVADSKDGRTRALDDAIARRLGANEARRRGLDSKIWVQAELVKIRSAARRDEEALLMEALGLDLAAEESPAEDVLRARYAAAPMNFAMPRWTLRTSIWTTREAAEEAIRTLDSTGFLAKTVFDDIGPAFSQEIPRWIKPHLAALDDESDRVVIQVPKGFALVEVARIEVVPPESFETVRSRLTRQWRRDVGQVELTHELARLRKAHDIVIRQGAIEDDDLWTFE